MMATPRQRTAFHKQLAWQIIETQNSRLSQQGSYSVAVGTGSNLSLSRSSCHHPGQDTVFINLTSFTIQIPPL